MRNQRQYTKINNCDIAFNKFKSKFRMSTILIIYSFLILAFTFANVVICINLQIYITSNQIEEISKQQLHLQNSKALNTQSYEMTHLFHMTFQGAVQKMGKLVSLNYLTPLNLNVIQNITFCSQAQQLEEQIQRATACLSAPEIQQQKTQPSLQFIQFLNLFQMQQQIFDFSIISKQLYFVSTIDNFLTAYYPIKQKNETLELFQYDWFINYTIQLQQNPAFQTLIPYVKLQHYEYLFAALAMLMIDKNYQISGFAVQIINLPELSHFLFVENINIILVYEDGKIMYTQSYIYNGLEKETRHIFNETISGFNQTDWEYIKSSINSSSPIYMYNSLLNQNVYIKAKQIPQTPLISLILTNITYENEIQKLLQEQIDTITNQQLNLLSYLTFASALIILLSLIPLKSLFKPTQIVINMMIKYLLGKFDNKIKDQLIRKSEIKQIDNVLNQLYEAYQRLDITLNQSQYIKSDHCMLIEKFFYQENVGAHLRLSFEKLKNKNEQISWVQFKQFIHAQNLVIA